MVTDISAHGSQAVNSKSGGEMSVGRRRKPTVGGILAATLFVSPIVALFSANALAPIGIISALLVCLVSWREGLLKRSPRPLVVALALLVVFGSMSIAWSIVPTNSLHKSIQLLFLFLAISALVGAANNLTADSRARAAKYLVAGMAVTAVIVAIEVLAGGMANHLLTDGVRYSLDSMDRYKRGVAFIALLAAPVAYYAWQRRGWLALISVLAIILGMATAVRSGTAGAALAVGALCATVVAIRPERGHKLLAATFAALVLIAPLTRFGPSEIPPDIRHDMEINGRYRVNSALHRFLIWQFAGERILERPILGWGLDSSRAVPGGRERLPGYPERIPLHPHNAALQLWLELGVVGAVLGAFIVGWVALRAGRVFAKGAPQMAAAGTLGVVATTALVGFGIWQSWWIAAIGLTAVAVMVTLPRPSEV